MTTRALKIAGLLAMTSAFVTLPLVYLSDSIDSRTDFVATVIKTGIQLSGTMLFVAIVLYLKKLLNAVFKFHDTDKNINLLMLASIAIGVFSLGALYIAPYKESLGSAVLVMLIAQGIVQVQFGYRLLKLPYDLGGLLKPFCYANMVTGVLLASVVLLPLGILISALSDLMLGTIFFNIAKLATTTGSGKA